MTSTRSGKTPGASPSPAIQAEAAALRGFDAARRRLGVPIADDASSSPRRARAEALADELLSLVRAVERETLA